ncbi:ABC transporter substrate-binding protein [Candidatus Roizmanbacteria bacterium]|nr:ABC transporter substrate-binding protein [Candidatus Roizmanbacteria bacterium]
MVFNKKIVRYHYWLVKEFLTKHGKLIAISFFISFLFIIAVISLSPYLNNLLSTKKKVVGLIGRYDFNSIPEEVTSLISNGLLYVNEHGEMVPVLATTWEVRNSGKEYRFHLKKNLIWDNGKKFTAADINYQFRDIKIKAVDENTIDFYLTKPLPIFPTYLRKPIIRYPIVGIAGLYHVNQIKTKYGVISELALEPNKKDLPSLMYRIYTNETLLLAAYKKGEINEFTVTKKSLADGFSIWKNTQIERAVNYSQLMTLFFNHSSRLLKQRESPDQKEIKGAIISAIDQSKMNELGEVANGPIQPVSWGYNPNLKKNAYEPEVSEKILRKHFESSQSAQLSLMTYYEYYDIADQIVTELRKVGLAVNLTIVAPDRQNDFDFLLALWKVPMDPDQYYFWHSTQTQGNIAGYKNVKVDKLLEDGRNTLLLEERKGIYFDYQRVVQDDPPAAFLYYPYVYTVKRK